MSSSTAISVDLTAATAAIADSAAAAAAVGDDVSGDDGIGIGMHGSSHSRCREQDDQASPSVGAYFPVADPVQHVWETK